ncbi:UDP-4-amino-4,6-dideoxy-N-acetyl-beta-L-altrosamine transaminase [Salibacterium salarium]|uniref:UDP-4-amino-4, 6-dideoxy-N-acetyl-beta-L-altrosamine transaminase n=1 Tax=Salibacterium salarium TaxID=284579 RepID=A0A3R9PC04_9BACI|nr:UDP-4-amino-4,6-dideoxy-N-acetyl-beta-L-altrosamine transaminase [Salibacterium salarium]RSL35109.1 UDP-4-amino-4,6-dideoxy-N-acetyl-beta-L-altrosamine transaminase [Salibacterium salarium]
MLALHNGKPVRQNLLPYGKQWLNDEDKNEVWNILNTSMITQGNQVPKFEEHIADITKTAHAVAFSSGTAALHAAFYAAELRAGDDFITTPITFAATANAGLYVGATPVFADIDDRTYNLDVTEASHKITTSTKAIVSVDFTGQPADYDGFRELADNHNLVYISDGAHSLGASYKGEPVGSQADMTMFSFHPVKPVTTGEGGVIVTDNSVYAERLRLFRSHGITKENISTTEPWYYEMKDLGMNYRMTDIQAALGTSQLKKLPDFIERRQKIAQAYNEAFSTLKNVKIPYQLKSTKSGWHLYILRLELNNLKKGRRFIFDALRAENIGVHVHYIPVYYHPYYQELGYEKGECPIAEKWYEEVLTLPLFPKMTDNDVHDVVLAVTKVLNEV